MRDIWHRTWIAAGLATAGVVVAAGLYIDELETGHTDVGSRVAPAEIKAAATDRKCVGTRPVPTDDDLLPDNPLDRTLVHLDKLTAGRHAAVYTGLSVDDDDNAVDVWRIPSSAFDTAACAAAEKGVRVRLHSTDVNREDLAALAERIGEGMNRWEGTFALREVGVDESGYVAVGVDDPDKARPVLEKEFGERYLKVEHVEQAHLVTG
ncbi:hypothetical protein [Streptomyces sp. AC555_RSS877]|uniref:hypothetical protein n=1 Tax=Streptomyces sp. AC555_RSS877 TaxID=2823688 RepID=UPI001C25D98C|nr:hypothetical protein [Streptomyces sp. AC555_RSS877]